MRKESKNQWSSIFSPTVKTWPCHHTRPITFAYIYTWTIWRVLSTSNSDARDLGTSYKNCHWPTHDGAATPRPPFFYYSSHFAGRRPGSRLGWRAVCAYADFFLIFYELTKIYFYCNVLQNYTTAPVGNSGRVPTATYHLGNSGRGMNLNGDKFYMKIVSFVEIYNFVV
jgi:hypothetical protein